jgi:hypothetical protein
MANVSTGGWREYRPTKAHAFWLAAGSVVAVLVIGFGPGGWSTAGTTERLVAAAADDARHALAAAVCVEQFKRTTDAGGQLDKIKQAAWFERGELVAAAGWATMPDETAPNNVVARMCADVVAELELPASSADATPEAPGGSTEG